MCYKNIKTLWIAVVSTVFFSFSASSVYAAGWTNLNKVERVYPRSEGFVYIDMFGAFSNPDNCSKTGFYYLPNNIPGFDAIYSAILGANFAEASIKLYVNGCIGGYPRVYHVNVY